MVNKIISPILYAVFLVPLFFGSVLIVTTVEYTIGFLYDMSGIVEMLIIILTLGTGLFWFANTLIVEREKLTKPRSLDHFRQSALYYVLICNAILYVSHHGIQGGLLEGYILVLAVISVWAIAINAFFLQRIYPPNS
ncbi:MAG: hypothetical protein CL685_02425 [Candidatus Magasanikbacteria bacterium]|nr:hypothetical protein [Candidatus Magasanikbacteria bacterium]|tara:strand:- start:38 stop:448 length:411 start_codon:yes stop_codon:yes gene_type:complete